MDDVVRLRPNSSYATLSAALTLSKGRRVALVFPVGERTCLRDTPSLDTLRTRCRQLGKEAVIIGGDAWLRAHAVAAGFEAATTLEDWGDTVPEHHAVRPRRTQDRAPSLRLVAPQWADTIIPNDNSDGDTWVSEPPEYVVTLRKAFADHSPVIQRPLLSLSLTPVTPDECDDDSLAASERFEEMVIGRILETSGIHRTAIPGAM